MIGMTMGHIQYKSERQSYFRKERISREVTKSTEENSRFGG